MAFPPALYVPPRGPSAFSHTLPQLLWAAIAQLLVGDWITGPLLGGCCSTPADSPAIEDRPLLEAPTHVVLICGAAFFLGAFAMALIGHWA